MEITQYKAINKGSLLGVFSLKLPKWGNLVIHDISSFQKDNQRWISFPSKIYEKDGKKQYFSYIRFEDQKTMQSFQEKVLEALDSYLKTHEPVESRISAVEIHNNEDLPF